MDLTKMKSSKDTSTNPKVLFSRLGKCLICKENEGKYTCPKCEMITCSLPCVKKHKKDFKCEGIRNKTEYVPSKKIDDLNILSDYRLLEELGRCVDACKRDTTRKITRKHAPLPKHLQRFRKTISERKGRIYFMPKNFGKHKENTTLLDWKEQRISWRLEVTFLHAKNYTLVVDKCSEDVVLEAVVEKCLKAATERKKEYKKHFDAYRSAKSDIEVYLKAEKIPEARNKFFLFDKSKSLKENLIGKRIVEYPHLYVTVKGFGSLVQEVQEGSKSKSKLDSLLLSSYSLSQDNKSNNSSDSEDDKKDTDEESNDSSDNDCMDRAFDILHTDEYKGFMDSLYKQAIENP